MTPSRAPRACVVVATSVLGLLSQQRSAEAQRSTAIPADRFVPAVGPGAMLQAEDGQVAPRFQLFGALAFSYLSAPIVLRGSDGAAQSDPVRDRVGADLALELGLGARLALGLGLPVVLFQGGDRLQGSGDPETARPLASSAVGDLRLRGKASLLRPGLPVTLGSVLELTVPAGGQEDFAASAAPTFAARLLFGARARLLSIALDAGVRFAPSRRLYQTPVGHRFEWAAALGLLPLPPRLRRPGLGVLAELAGAVDPLVGLPADASRSVPVEARGALRGVLALPFGPVTLDLGAGLGLTSAAAAPAYRVFLLLRGALSPEPRKNGAAGP